MLSANSLVSVSGPAPAPAVVAATAEEEEGEAAGPAKSRNASATGSKPATSLSSSSSSRSCRVISCRWEGWRYEEGDRERDCEATRGTGNERRRKEGGDLSVVHQEAILFGSHVGIEEPQPLAQRSERHEAALLQVKHVVARLEFLGAHGHAATGIARHAGSSSEVGRGRVKLVAFSQGRGQLRRQRLCLFATRGQYRCRY